jgi:hypothetical protein
MSNLVAPLNQGNERYIREIEKWNSHQSARS